MVLKELSFGMALFFASISKGPERNGQKAKPPICLNYLPRHMTSNLD